MNNLVQILYRFRANSKLCYTVANSLANKKDFQKTSFFHAR